MHRIHEFFPIEHAASDRFLAGCDVRAKILVAAATIAAVLLSTGLCFPLIVSLACVLGLLAARVPLRVVFGRLAAPLGLAIVVCLLRSVLAGSTPLLTVGIGSWQVVVTREGLLDGLALAFRVLGAMSVVVLLGMVTPPQRIFAALHWARVPRTWVEIALLMYRYIFVLFEQAFGVIAAQKARLGYAGLRRSMRSLGSLAGIIVLRSLDQAEQTHEAMVARGYHGRLPIPPLPALPLGQMAFGGLFAAGVFAAYWLLERWPG